MLDEKDMRFGSMDNYFESMDESMVLDEKQVQDMEYAPKQEIKVDNQSSDLRKHDSHVMSATTKAESNEPNTPLQMIEAAN